MFKKKSFMWRLWLCIFSFDCSGDGMAAWGSKELETEKMAVNFAREVIKGGYRIVSTEELKGWIDQKKDMFIVDTMPYEDSYKKQHVPGAVQFEFPVKKRSRILTIKQKRLLQSYSVRTKTVLIVIYCGFTKCGRSHNGAMLL